MCGHRWSQTIDEVVVFLDCSPYSTRVKGKDVRCEVGKKSIHVSLAPAPSSADPPPLLIKGELFAEVLQDDVVWHIEDGKFVTVTMEKRKKTWWKSALVGDAEIDTQKVDSTCSIDDYDQPTQAAIQKLMFDQHQKIQGKPTSDELQQHDMLRKAWDAEGRCPCPLPLSLASLSCSLFLLILQSWSCSLSSPLLLLLLQMVSHVR